MKRLGRLLAHFSSSAAIVLSGAAWLMASSPAAAAAPCQGPPGTPAPTQTKCLTAIAITGTNTPGHPLRSFDISWVSLDRGEYYLADRSNAGIDVIDTKTLTFTRTIGGFVGIVNNPNGTVNNNKSGPDGVTSYHRWLYAGDGDSTLKVIDLEDTTGTPIKQSIPTGGSTRVDEMALTNNGKILIAANNAEDPPFATLFNANGNGPSSNVSIISRITVDSSIIPPHFGLSLEQPAWDNATQRFYTSIPIIANNPMGCNYGQLAGPITCHGGLLVVDPSTVATLALPASKVYGAFDPATNTGVVPLTGCGPNGATVGRSSDILLGCTPGNNPSDKITLIYNAKTRVQTAIANITGSDEVWYNVSNNRYYLGASRDIGTPSPICAHAMGVATSTCPVLGVVGLVGGSEILIEKIPQSSGSHSVAADSARKLVFVPQVAPVSVVGTGGDTTGDSDGASNSALICGTTNGCVAVYSQ
jgi:hypothetical protein